MSERIHALAQRMLGKTSWEECSLNELQQLAERYPFFAPAQFFYLHKLQDTDLAAFEKQQQKAVLYYPDPLQFSYFMSQNRSAGPESDEADTVVNDIENNAALAVTDLTTEEHSLLQQADFQTIDHFGEDVTLATPAINGEHVMALAEEDSHPELVHQQEEVENVYLSVPHKQLDSISETTDVTLTEEEKTEVPESIPAEAVLNSTHPIEDVVDVHPAEENGQAEVMLPPSPQMSTNAQVETTLFEPFHTVDYFASQGIKITADELPKDKLSKQLRSFTEWLKVMKRLPAAEVGQAITSSAEKKVENLAGHSVEGTDVVTEAMAEVWAKQGAAQKAEETYNKLSLLYPSKKAYFAAKIENLKGS